MAEGKSLDIMSGVDYDVGVIIRHYPLSYVKFLDYSLSEGGA